MLMQAISRDASFLQANEVMDYSMLVGQCDEKKTLYLGIIGNYFLKFEYAKMQIVTKTIPFLHRLYQNIYIRQEN